MAFPPRRRPARSEPSFTPVGAAPREALPLRNAPQRPPKPANEAEREPLRFPADHRRGAEPQSLSLTASDRLVVSSGQAAAEKRKGGFFRRLGFAILLVLAAIGAYALYQTVAPYLP